ncbi:Carbamoyltransferase HypF [subsurface metagenome]
MKEESYCAETINVIGIVQGVGFRPFVYNLAKKHNLHGYILNNPDGVLIEIAGESGAIDSFLDELERCAPPLSRIHQIKRNHHAAFKNRQEFLDRYKDFEIRESVRGNHPRALISPDICICEECLNELFDRKNRRYLYPFINCTNCGPRFTIINGLPYDRPQTTMAGFAMCPICRSEYTDSENRRFHAQPNACVICGPTISLLDCDCSPIAGDPVLTAIDLLKKGHVLAVKGLGGFHLAVDASNDRAVKKLRKRKNREEKPLALMTGTISGAKRLIEIDPIEERALCGRERPILLAPRCDTEGVISSHVAPDNRYLGVMLPYTPLHYLLFFYPQAGGNYSGGEPIFRALVMTSGNLSEEPICKDNDEALKRLAGIADAYLVHNRDIFIQCDDSVVNVSGNDLVHIRRSRGYVPVPVFIKEPAARILAVGGEMKNTLCFIDGRRAFMSQHIGDLENSSTLAVFQKSVDHFKNILKLESDIYAYDLHPDYLSTKYVFNILRERTTEEICAVGVQHHHAHIAAVLAEHGHNEPVIGFSMDGTGYGMDGAVWGGEALLCTPETFVRAAHLDYVPMPGSAAAIREPWRMALSYLKSAYNDRWKQLKLPCLEQVSASNLDILDQAISAGLNCPSTSSLGRLFDAVASILDIGHYASFEGQLALMLEMLAAETTKGIVFPYEIKAAKPEKYDDYPVLHGISLDMSGNHDVPLSNGYMIDYKSLIRAITEGMISGEDRRELALSFHLTLLKSFLDIGDRLRDETGIDTVVLAGGCWQNRILYSRFPAMLKENGFTVLLNSQIPPNDGGLALGQAYIAARLVK